jgi:antirestriction protein ArdC
MLTPKTSGQDTIYQMVTDRIMAELEKGIVPWHKPWQTSGLPKNLVSKKEYRGINVFLLSCTEFASPYWLSFKQVKELGGQVKKDSKSTVVVFWKWLDVADKENPDKPKQIPMLRYYRVFNLEQTTGIDPKRVPESPEQKPNQHSPIEQAETIIAGMPNRPEIIDRDKNRAFYDPLRDVVNVPPLDRFESPEQYYSTTFHELTHSTGHEKRVGRRQSTEQRNFGDSAYSKEELVAEFGAAFLCGHTGIVQQTVEQSAAYIGGWLKALKNDKRLAVYAAAQAQKAADYILGIAFDKAGAQ